MPRRALLRLSLAVFFITFLFLTPNIWGHNNYNDNIYAYTDAELSDAQQILNTDFEVSSTSDNPADYCVENSLCNGGAHQESVAVENMNNSEISPQQIAYQSTYHG